MSHDNVASTFVSKSFWQVIFVLLTWRARCSLVPTWYRAKSNGYESDLSSRSCPATEQLTVGAGDSTALLGK